MVDVGVLVVVEGGVVSGIRHLFFLLLPRFCAIVRSHHAQHTWQEVEEDETRELAHPVRTRRAEVPVDDEDGDENGHDVHDEREEEELGDERNVDGGRRQDFGKEEDEDDERQHNRDAHRHLLASIRRKEEDADAEEGDEDAWNDEVDGVEECPPADDEEELDVGAIMSLILAVFLP